MWAQRRDEMVTTQIEQRGVRHPEVLAAMRTVPRERFMPEEVLHLATVDRPVPIGDGQTISQPFIVALMAEAALGDRPRVGRLLEIGTGCGYSAAVLATLADHVVSVERLDSLAERARSTLEDVGVCAVEVLVGDGTLGHRAGGPYDAIVVTAGGPTVPDALVAQLAVGGRLVIPVGDASSQRLVVVVRSEDGVATEDLGAVRFVPLIGAQGWAS